MSTDATEPCPFCGETIKAGAVKCRYCGEFLEEPPEPVMRAPRAGDAEEAIQFIVPVNVSGWALAACYAGLIGMLLPVVGFIFALPAVIFAIIALKRRPKGVTYGGVTGNIRAVLGLVFGGIGVLVWGFTIVLIILGTLGLI